MEGKQDGELISLDARYTGKWKQVNIQMRQ